MPSLNSDKDRMAICDGISEGVSNIQESSIYLSNISGASPFAISKKYSQGLLIPQIQQLSESCEVSVTLCRQADHAVQNYDNNQFTNNLEQIHSNLMQITVDYNEVTVLINTNSSQQ